MRVIWTCLHQLIAALGIVVIYPAAILSLGRHRPTPSLQLDRDQSELCLVESVFTFQLWQIIRSSGAFKIKQQPVIKWVILWVKTPTDCARNQEKRFGTRTPFLVEERVSVNSDWATDGLVFHVDHLSGNEVLSIAYRIDLYPDSLPDTIYIQWVNPTQGRTSSVFG